MEDEGPDEAQDELEVATLNVTSTWREQYGSKDSCDRPLAPLLTNINQA